MARARKQTQKKGSELPPAPAAGASDIIWSAWRPHIQRLAVVWLLALAAYSNSFRAGLVFDNGVIVLKDTRIRAVTPENVGLIFSTGYWATGPSSSGFRPIANSLYRPFTTLTYLFNWAVLGNGDSPAGYHWVNFGLHALNIALVYALGLLLFGEATSAWAMAALWAVHPVLTESVTNVVGRADLLAAASILAGLLCYVQARRSPSNKKLYRLAALGTIAAVGVFSKESAIVLVAVMLLWDWTTSEPLPWRERWPAYAALAPGYALFFGMRASMLASSLVAPVSVVDNPLVGADFWTARITAIKTAGLGLWKMCWPQHLSADYSYNQIPLFGWRLNDWADWQAILALAVCLAAAGLAAWAFRHAKPVFFLIGLIFAALAPTANVFLLAGTIFGERFLYLPAVGMAGLAALALSRIFRDRTAVVAAAGLLALALAVRTWFRNDDWRDDRALFTSVVAESPESAKGQFTLSSLLVTGEPRMVDQSLEHAQRAIEIMKPLPDAETESGPFYIAGMCERLKGDASTDAATRADWYRKAVEILLRVNAIDRADTDRAGPGVFDPERMKVYLELGRVYERIGQPDNAIAALLHGRCFEPLPEFSEELSSIYADKRDIPAAARSLVEGLLIDPATPRLSGELAKLYSLAYAQTCALRQTGSGAVIDRSCPLVRAQICDGSRVLAAAYRAAGLSANGEAILRSAASSSGCPM